MNHEGYRGHERRAMLIELEARGLPYEAERAVAVSYRGVAIPGRRIDLIVGGLIVVELKAVVRFDQVHIGQVISYLKTVRLRGGLLINFLSLTPRPRNHKDRPVDL